MHINTVPYAGISFLFKIFIHFVPLRWSYILFISWVYGYVAPLELEIHGHVILLRGGWRTRYKSTHTSFVLQPDGYLLSVAGGAPDTNQHIHLFSFIPMAILLRGGWRTRHKSTHTSFVIHPDGYLLSVAGGAPDTNQHIPLLSFIPMAIGRELLALRDEYN